MRDFLTPLRLFETLILRVPVIIVASIMITYAVYAEKRQDEVRP